MTAEDPCCGTCQSTTGVCLSRHQCYHHKAAQKQRAADDRARRTHYDPTADAAIARADRRPRTRGGRR